MTDVNIIRGGNIKVGDTLPDLKAQLLDGGSPINLTDFTVSVKIKLAEADTLLVDDTATIDIEERGIVEYEWSSGDTDTAGTYLVEFIADNQSGEILTFPNNGYARVYIDPRLGT